MNKILEHTLEYLRKTIPDFKESRDGFTCPQCKYELPTCNFISKNSYTMGCIRCKFSGEIIELINPDKNKALIEIRDLLNLPVHTKQEVNELFDYYEKLGFDCLPITPGDKIPLEKEWQNKIHKDKSEWIIWYERNLNIGVKCKASKVTIIDFDDEIPAEIKPIMDKIKTLRQITNKGAGHWFFIEEPDLPKTRIVKYKIDIENDNGQVVIEPSIINNVKRTIIKNDIVKMPDELKKWLLANISMPSSHDSDVREYRKESLCKFNLIKKGDGRNNFLIRMGGIFRNSFSLKDTKNIINILNNCLCDPPIPQTGVNATVMRGIEKYYNIDEAEVARKIFKYMEVVEECTSRDIKEALGFGKEKIDNILSYLIREEMIIKRGRLYHILKKADWKDTWVQESKEIDFSIPYLHDTAYVRDGDMILIGGASGTGKTTVAINMIKLFKDQGIETYYIGRESGSRFGLLAEQLGLPEGSFKWIIHYSPERIELEDNAVTILDWLLPSDYAQTDKIYERFSHQLVKHGGILIVFCQLRNDPEKNFFSKDLITFFPSLIAKFMYTNDDGTTSKFETVKIREPKDRTQNKNIPCIYDWEHKILRRADNNNIDEKYRK